MQTICSLRLAALPLSVGCPAKDADNNDGDGTGRADVHVKRPSRSSYPKSFFASLLFTPGVILCASVSDPLSHV